MRVKDYLKQVAYIKELDLSNGNNDPDFISDCYFSKFDNSYITRVGLEKDIKFLAEREITEDLTHGVGYSPKDKKWYGWSHRAIFGFKIGSTCKKGDCHYNGSTLQEQEEAAILFWSDTYHMNTHCAGIITDSIGNKFFDITWTYPDNTPDKELRGTECSIEHFVTPLGKGEWTATTMEDAKQMAKDFNKGVS